MTAYAIVVLVMVLAYTFYMGVNDGSNAVATTVATRAVKPRTAVVIAAITQFLAPVALYFLGFMSVASNISEKLVFNSFFSGLSMEKAFAFIFSGMLAALVWGIVTFVFKFPNSTSHTLLGGIIGSGMAAFGFGAIQWKEFVLLNVVLMIIIAPFIGMLLGFVLTKICKRLARRASRGLNVIMNILQRINLIILAAAFSGNNAQKALGVFFLLGVLGLSGYGMEAPIWAVIACSGALTLGMLCGGYRVINTVGRKIFKLEPMHSIVAQVSTSAVMLAATGLGISVSTGQIMSSSIMGVGASEKLSKVNWNTAGRIISCWGLTLPVAAALGALFYVIVGKLILGC